MKIKFFPIFFAETLCETKKSVPLQPVTEWTIK